MKIAIFHELSEGGALEVVRQHAKYLIQQKHEVTIFETVPNGETSHISDLDCKVHTTHLTFSAKTPKGILKRLWFDFVQLWKLQKIHQSVAHQISVKNPDLVYIHGSRFTQAPFILRYLNQSTVYFCQEPLRIVYDPLFALARPNSIKTLYELCNRWRRKRIDRTNIQHATKVLANSAFSQNNILNAYKIKAQVCYLGVNTDEFKPMPSLIKQQDILFIGEATVADGFNIFQEVVLLLPAHTSKRVISRNASGEGIPITELVKAIQTSKCVLCLSRNEPFGLIPLEAMACGIPVIALNEGGYAESVIDSTTGYLIEPNSAKIANSIQVLLLNNKQRNNLGLVSRRQVLNFWTWQKSGERLLAILSQSRE